MLLSLKGKIPKRGILQWLKAAVDAELQTTKVGSDEIDDVLTKQQPCESDFNNYTI